MTLKPAKPEPKQWYLMFKCNFCGEVFSEYYPTKADTELDAGNVMLRARTYVTTHDCGTSCIGLANIVGIKKQ